jgi:hypothetical protein
MSEIHSSKSLSLGRTTMIATAWMQSQSAHSQSRFPSDGCQFATLWSR